jgi:protein ImuB
MREAGLFACVDLPDLPLQILRRDRPELARHPLAVVTEDRPDAPLTHVDAKAARLRLSTGMRYGAARSLVPALRAGPVSEERVGRVVEELVVALQTFSPRVEPDEDRPGTFYVDPSGLGRIYGDPRTWAEAVHGYLKGRGFSAAVVIAHGRFPAFAIGRTVSGALVLADAKASKRRLAAVPLGALGISPRLRDDLHALSVRTVGDLVGLPAGELKSRFGEEAARLQAMAAGDAQLPIQPRAFDEPIEVSLEIDPPDQDHARLLFGIKGALHELLTNVRARALVLAALQLRLDLEDGHAREERIEPAAPTRDAMLLLDLARLRLADTSLPAAVERLTLTAETARADGDQLAMFRLGPRRDLAAGERALARVRAAFGQSSVVRPRLRDAHLPEARFAWEPVDRLRLSKLEADREEGAPPLVRRVLSRPRPLASRDASDPDAGPALVEGDEVLRLFGPYRISGGWWVREVERDYYYAETASGELLWVYWDRPRRRWFLHGMVD